MDPKSNIIEEEAPIILNGDFYSFALFAFYFVDDDEKLIYNSPKSEKGKRALTDDEQELEFKRYGRRIRNNNILFKCLAIFIIQLSLILLMVQYYKDIRAKG